MASLIQTYYEQAQLSDAAYADLLPGMSSGAYRQALRDRGFTIEEAADFAGKYAIVDVFSDDETSFYAVLFQEKDANGNLTNKKTLAIRGTGDPFDLFITDQQLALLGATSQDFSMRASYADVLAELAPTDVLTVTGHSLGGFLAQAFATDFPYPILHAYTYNGAGLGSFLSNPFGLLGISKSIPNDRITNLVGQGQTLVASTGTQLGSKQNIFIEETSILANPIANHLIEPLKDSLALYALFATIDPSLDQRIYSITEILNAASSIPETSLESALDAMRKLFQGANVTSPTTLGSRVEYYENIQSLRAVLSPGGVGQLLSLVNMSGGAIAALARQDIAYRYALNELNPFVVLGANYDPHNAGGILDLYDAKTGQGAWTSLALNDRAELLATKNLVNVNDGGVLAGLSADTRFVDIQTGFEFGNTLTASNDIIFGDNRVGDVISGRGGDDHLYGRGGADTIEGNGGRDYIEGNDGNDVLLSGGGGDDIILGQEGNDTLEGGADNDQLNGGLGDDTLKGGEGSDRYSYFAGQGRDTIEDSDRSGNIFFDGLGLLGGVHREGDPENTYVSPDGQFTYVRQGDDVLINDVLRGRKTGTFYISR